MFSKTCLVVVLTFASSAFAQGAATCDAQAAEKKLSGAAKTSFLKKCKEDAAAQCEVQAKEKNLAGAAKTSFTTKCVKDAGAQ
jgi:hypothetical protein